MTMPFLVLESAHPSQKGEKNSRAVFFPDALGIFVEFDSRSSTEGSITFFADESHTRFFGSPRYGGKTNLFPGVGTLPPLIIPANAMIVYSLGGLSTSWGYRVKLKPLFPWSPITHGVCILESHHPVGIVQHQQHFCVPGAQSLTVSFDPRTSWNGPNSCVDIRSESKECTCDFTAPAEDGTWRLPGVGGEPVLTIPGDSGKLHFKSCENDDGWGFKVTVRAAGQLSSPTVASSGPAVVATSSVNPALPPFASHAVSRSSPQKQQPQQHPQSPPPTQQQQQQQQPQQDGKGEMEEGEEEEEENEEEAARYGLGADLWEVLVRSGLTAHARVLGEGLQLTSVRLVETAFAAAEAEAEARLEAESKAGVACAAGAAAADDAAEAASPLETALGAVVARKLRVACTRHRRASVRRLSRAQEYLEGDVWAALVRLRLTDCAPRLQALHLRRGSQFARVSPQQMQRELALDAPTLARLVAAVTPAAEPPPDPPSAVTAAATAGPTTATTVAAATTASAAFGFAPAWSEEHRVVAFSFLPGREGREGVGVRAATGQKVVVRVAPSRASFAREQRLLLRLQPLRCAVALLYSVAQHRALVTAQPRNTLRRVLPRLRGGGSGGFDAQAQKLEREATARQLAEALCCLHAQGLVHCRVSVDAVVQVYDGAALTFRFCDLSHARTYTAATRPGAQPLSAAAAAVAQEAAATGAGGQQQPLGCSGGALVHPCCAPEVILATAAAGAAAAEEEEGASVVAHPSQDVFSLGLLLLELFSDHPPAVAAAAPRGAPPPPLLLPVSLSGDGECGLADGGGGHQQPPLQHDDGDVARRKLFAKGPDAWHDAVEARLQSTTTAHGEWARRLLRRMLQFRPADRPSSEDVRRALSSTITQSVHRHHPLASSSSQREEEVNGSTPAAHSAAC